MSDSMAWRAWDGHCLSWQLSSPADARIELRVDGVIFERSPATREITSREFVYSPTGNNDVEFSLHDVNGIALTPAWRVTFGTPASAGVQQWQGPFPPLRSARATAPIGRTLRGPVTIIVPIFNAAALVERCIESVIRWTSAPAQLILIDDASTDAAIVSLLKKYAGYSNVSIHRNAENLGYTKSCNFGIELAGSADIVLLNSDTQVGPRWLDRLTETAQSDASIGTVTAVSDNAGAFSVPELEQFNPIPERWTLQQTQRALLQRISCPDPELPTGNGFCMFVRRSMLDDVGALDADAFPFGYGEENDLCQRAERAGYRHVIAGDVLVAHARSASFGDERRAELGVRGMAVLRERYPDYETKVGATLFGFARRVLDYRVRRIYADSDRVYEKTLPRARLLCVVAHTDDWVDVDFPDSFERFVACGDDAIGLYSLTNNRCQEIARVADPIALADWLVRWSIEFVCASADVQSTVRWRQAAEKVAIPFVNCPNSAAEIEVRCRDAWNSIAAFRSS